MESAINVIQDNGLSSVRRVRGAMGFNEIQTYIAGIRFLGYRIR